MLNCYPLWIDKDDNDSSALHKMSMITKVNWTSERTNKISTISLQLITFSHSHEYLIVFQNKRKLWVWKKCLLLLRQDNDRIKITWSFHCNEYFTKITIHRHTQHTCTVFGNFENSQWNCWDWNEWPYENEYKATEVSLSFSLSNNNCI